VQIPIYVSISALSDDIVRNSSAICVEFDIQLALVSLMSCACLFYFWLFFWLIAGDLRKKIEDQNGILFDEQVVFVAFTPLVDMMRIIE